MSTVTSPRACKYCAAHPRHGHLTWAALIALCLALEAEGLRREQHDHTLSHATRFVFQTQSTVGKVAFSAAWATLTFWFMPHVIKNGIKK